MIAIDPVAHALVPVDSAAADDLGAPNYDEFQSDREVWELLQKRPHSVLRATMPHCDVPTADAIGEDGSGESLEHARRVMREIIADPRTREVRNLLWVYEIIRPGHEDRPQIGLGGMARTGQIRTPENPKGTIIRNEGIREAKARGRARLTEATRADMGTVNLAIDDATGEIQEALEEHARTLPSFETRDEEGNRHRVWLVTEPAVVQRFRSLLAREPHAYVADGNHRSAAAAMLGYEHYLAVIFPAATMTIAPYNRLIEDAEISHERLLPELEGAFEVETYPENGAFQPEWTHEIGFYDGRAWRILRPRPGTFDPSDAAQAIDADIVQRKLFAEVFGIPDARDERLTFVGANRDARWLQRQVDAGGFRYAVTLPPVTMQQFIDVCLQNKLMPPKSTWFVPKVRSGLVMAML
ncbi:MAG TPA: DUF1015 family protein [Gemmatimonadaceae bacterium]|nr:DUF1015 family protein [Gemmatimonadaceae bacterium]